MRNVKQTVSALSTVIFTIASAYTMDADEVMCEEVMRDEVYNIQLKVETVEVDINEIPENREVKVGISIDNNPGFLGLWFPIEWDDRLTYPQYFTLEPDYSKLSAGFAILHGRSNAFPLSIIHQDLNTLYSENTELLKIRYVLPENVKSGDWFAINIVEIIKDTDATFGTGFDRDNSLEIERGPENFAPFINGGIRIVGQEPEPVQEPPQESEPPVQPSEPDIAPPQPAEETQQNNNVQQQVIVETTVPVTEVTTTETTTVTTSTTTTVTTVPETTVSTTISEKTTTEETTVSGTPVTEVSENSTDDEKEKKNIIPIIVSGIAVIAAVITGVIFRRKKENKK